MTISRRSLICSLCAGLAPALVHARQKSHTPRSIDDVYARIDKLIENECSKDGRGGVIAGVLHKGQLKWSKSYGLADEAQHRQIRRDSVFPVASVTKIVTGIALLQLVERGVVHLSDPVERYVPEVKAVSSAFPWAPPITLIQLATMTAGLERDPLLKDGIQSESEATATWEEQLVLALPKAEQTFEPGTVNRYSNLSFCVLGLAIERAANIPFSKYIATHILEPLGMTDSGFAVTDAMKPRLVLGYSLVEREVSVGSPPNSESFILLPAGGLLSTLDDLTKLMQFQMGLHSSAVLSQAAQKAAYRLLVASDANFTYGDGVGFAAVRNPQNKLVALGHGGLFKAGFSASYEFDAAMQSGVILLTNTSFGKAQYKPLVRQILELLNPASGGGSGLPALEEH